MHLSPRSSAPGARRINWRGAFVWLAAVALASVSTIAAAQETVAPVETHVDHAGLVKLGWQLVCPLSTFRPLTCAEAIDQLHALGIHHIEVDATQAIAPGRPAAFVIPSAGPADLAALTEKLSAVRMDIVTYDAGQIPADEPSLRKLFELAGKLKVKNIAGTPDAASLPVLDRLSAEYKVRFAIRNQPLSAAFARPEAMLGALKDCSERIGCCADLPAWKSLGLTPADCVRALGARVFEIELSDADPQNRSVVLGTGRIGALQVLRALKDESFRGAIAVAYAGDEARRSANWATSINVFSDFVTTLTSAVPGSGGQALSDDEITGAAKDTARGFGDAPDVVPAIATDLSPALTSGEVRKAMRKVADWQLARAQSRFTQAWTFGVLYTGLIAASKTTGDSKYADAVRDLGRETQWSLGRPTNSPDNQCLGQSYADLFLESSDPAVLAPTREAMDRAILAPPSPRKKITWWWCDALFMAPGAWARLARDTGDAKYLAFLDHEWWTCSDALYNPKEHLYSRDATFLAKREPNGKPVLWSRGNGWVLAGIARTLPLLPADYPSRAKYVTQFRDMSARIVELQGSDGLWSASLLDPATYPLPEVSGSALFIYALAWGINTGLLDRATFEPVVARGWAGLLAHIYADGRLGCIQQTGAAPAHYKMSSSYVYGVGAFLLAVRNRPADDGPLRRCYFQGRQYRVRMESMSIMTPLALAAIALLSPVAGIARADPPALAHFTVANDLDIARPDSVIDLPLSDVTSRMAGVAPAKIGVRAPGGRVLVTQLIDESGGGAPDHILVLADLGPKQTQRLELFAAPAPLSFPARVFGRFAPERKDDFAWESDKIAYRMYGPALQATGEISSGVDVWSKRVPQLILNDWYRREAEAAKIGKEAVHTDVGTGLDCYKTGPARGCGGTAVWTGDKLIASKNFVTYEVLANGPIRVVFELTYAPWDANGVSISEVKRISLDAGSHFNHLQSTFHFTGPDTVTIAAGLQMHKGAVLHDTDGSGFASIWEPADLHAGMMATGLVLEPGTKAAFKEAAKHAIVLFDVKSDHPISYYAGAGWSQSDVTSQDLWDTMLGQLAAEIGSPVRVSWE